MSAGDAERRYVIGSGWQTVAASGGTGSGATGPTGSTGPTGAGGGSGSIVDWLDIERQNNQTLPLVGDSTFTAISFDAIFDQGDGSAISWDIGDPTKLTFIADGWYSIVATLFFAAQPGDAATAVWTVGFGGAGTQISETGPVNSTAQPNDGQTHGLFCSFPAFKALVGDWMGVSGGITAGASGASTLTFAEVLLVKLVG